MAATAQTDSDLLELISRSQTGDRRAMDDMMMALEPVCRRLCRRFLPLASAVSDRDDFRQAARIAAYRSALGYDPSRGVHPLAWISFAVNQGLLRHIRLKCNRTGDVLSLDAPAYDDDDDHGRSVSDFGGDANITAWHPEDWDMEVLLDRLPRETPDRGAVELERRLTPRLLNTALPPDSEMVRLVAEGWTDQQIADRYETPINAVLHRLRVLRLEGQLQNRARGTYHRLPDADDLIPLIVQGCTLQDLADRYGVTKMVVSGHLTRLRKAGLPVPMTERARPSAPPKERPKRANPKLPPDEVLIKRVEQGRTYAELAEEFGMTLLAVKGHLTRLRKQGLAIPAVAKPKRLNPKFPSDAVLIDHVRRGLTLPELADLLGLTPGIVQSRLSALRRAGTTIPVVRRSDAGKPRGGGGHAPRDGAGSAGNSPPGQGGL